MRVGTPPATGGTTSAFGGRCGVPTITACLSTRTLQSSAAGSSGSPPRTSSRKQAVGRGVRPRRLRQGGVVGRGRHPPAGQPRPRRDSRRQAPRHRLAAIPAVQRRTPRTHRHRQRLPASAAAIEFLTEKTPTWPTCGERKGSSSSCSTRSATRTRTAGVAIWGDPYHAARVSRRCGTRGTCGHSSRRASTSA